MGLVDAIIIVILMIGILDGVRKGALGTLVSFFGSLLVFILSWELKGQLANFLISKLPVIGGNAAISVLIYTIIAFILLLIVFGLIYEVLIKVTKVVEKIFDATIVLGFVSRIIGAILGFFKAYIFIFIVVFVLSIFNISYLNNSKLYNTILEKTPVVGNVAKSTWNMIKDVYNNKDVSESLNDMVNNKILTEENKNKLLGGN